MSLVDKYLELCRDAKVKANSAVKTYLEGESFDMETWDLSANVVGTRGAAVVARLAAENLPKLHTLLMPENNLTSPATEALLSAFQTHPAIRGIDLSSNDIRLGGPALVELVKRNRNIVMLNIQKTHLRPLFERLIGIHLKRNQEITQQKTTKKKKREPKFTFGEAAPEVQRNDNFGAAEDEAFAAFSDAVHADMADRAQEHVTFAGGAGGGKKVRRRPTVCSEAYKEDEIDNFVPAVHEKEDRYRIFLKQTLERHDLFSHLEDHELFIAIDAMVENPRSEGDLIFEEGEEDGDLFYVVAGGEFELRQGDEVLEGLKKGGTTQDVMLMYPGEYKESLFCTQDGTLFSLDRQTYRCVLSQASKKKRALYEGFLGGVGFLKSLNKSELLQLADALKPAAYDDGDKLIKYGEVGANFFLIVEGTVDVYGRDDAGEPIHVCSFKEGDCVGELEFINNHKTVADVLAKGPIRTAKMNRRHFEMVMGPVKDVLARNAEENEVYGYYREQLAKQKEGEHGASTDAPPL